LQLGPPQGRLLHHRRPSPSPCTFRALFKPLVNCLIPSLLLPSTQPDKTHTMQSKFLLCLALACLAVAPALGSRALGEHSGCFGGAGRLQSLVPARLLRELLLPRLQPASASSSYQHSRQHEALRPRRAAPSCASSGSWPHRPATARQHLWRVLGHSERRNWQIA
jgi:hypothetical protein